MKELKLGYMLVAADHPLMDKYDRWQKTTFVKKLVRRRFKLTFSCNLNYLGKCYLKCYFIYVI